ncbi:hypothetical protein ATCC90586_006320 [Pythium insidiosum]|nr:hypothetical protein ATCC90586_006320 [Pythium insidiosum]
MRLQRWVSGVIALLAPCVTAAQSVLLQCNVTSESQDSKPRWELVSSLTFSRDSHAAAVYKNRIWIVGGVSTSYYTKRLEHTTTRSDVLSSADGVTWKEALEEAPFRRRFGHSLTAFVDGRDDVERLVLLGGFSPEPATDIWTTTDGERWAQVDVAVPWPGRGYHCTVAFRGRLWVMGGSPLTNDVWSTPSLLAGAVWEQQRDVPWSPRAAHACAVHKVRLNESEGDSSDQDFVFLMGGWDETSRHDVWRMDDAGAWVRLLESAPWKKRGWHSIVSFDSRTHGDIIHGPRLWLLGGGIIGKGIEKMFPYTDVWFTRNGSTWQQASSDSSGISTAEWSIVSTRDSRVCLGKWGHAAVAFRRTVPRAYVCGDTCVNEHNNTRLAGQLIPVCKPETSLPSPPELRTVLKQNSVTTRTLYPDGCGLCFGEATDRYENTTSVPALYLIAGNVGSQKVKDIFVSDDAMLCERDGVICSDQGTCTLGGTCLCISGKTGQFCDSDLDYVVLDKASCFPPDARVLSARRGAVAIGDVAIGEQLLTLDRSGRPQFAHVYYIPHDVTKESTRFIRVRHAPLGSDDSQTLEVTPSHLLYVTTAGADVAPGASVDMTSLSQKTARELRPGDRLVVISRASPAPSVATSRVVALESVTRRGAVTVYTTTGTVVVEGVLCSNFADLYPRLGLGLASRDALPFALFAPHRLLFSLWPSPSTARLLRNSLLGKRCSTEMTRHLEATLTEYYRQECLRALYKSRRCSDEDQAPGPRKRVSISPTPEIIGSADPLVDRRPIDVSPFSQLEMLVLLSQRTICASPLSSSAEEDNEENDDSKGADVYDDWRHLQDAAASAPQARGRKPAAAAARRQRGDDTKRSKRKRSDSETTMATRRSNSKAKKAKGTADKAAHAGPISKKDLVATASERFVQYLADQLDASNQATLCEEFGFGHGYLLRLPTAWPEVRERRAFAAWATSLGFAASAVQKQLYRISSLNMEILLPELRKRVRVRRESDVSITGAGQAEEPKGNTVDQEDDDHVSAPTVLPDVEAASLQSFKEHFQRLDEEELEMLSVAEHDRLLSTIRHEQIAEAMEEVLARPSVRKDRDRARRMSRLGRIAGRRLSAIPLRPSIAVGAADQFGWAEPILEEEEEDEDEGDDDYSSQSHRTSMEVIYDCCPRGHYLSDGAYKEVFKVFSVRAKRLEAVSVMNIRAIERTGNEHIVRQEVAHSVLLSELVRSQFSPHFVEIYDIVLTRERPQEHRWGSAACRKPVDLLTGRRLNTVTGQRNGGADEEEEDAEEDPLFQYIRMELCDGGDVEDFIGLQDDKLLPVRSVVIPFFFQMVFGLYCARERYQLRHCDIKLLNFFLKDISRKGLACAPDESLVLRYWLGETQFDVRMPATFSYWVKLADYGTADSTTANLGQPVTLDQFTTLENTPIEFLLEGDAATQSFAADTFSLGLCLLHLFTGRGPYEELVEPVRCPPLLLQDIKRLWMSTKKNSGFTVLKRVARDDPDDVLIHTLYRYLVLFGLPLSNPSEKRGIDRVWNILVQHLRPSPDDGDGAGARRSRRATAKPQGPSPKAQFDDDRAAFGLDIGSNAIIAHARERLSSVPGAPQLLASLVAFDPTERPTLKSVLHHEIFASLRTPKGVTDTCPAHYEISSYAAFKNDTVALTDV